MEETHCATIVPRLCCCASMHLDRDDMIEISYVPARYVENKRSFVIFYAWHPEKEKLHRVRKSMDRLKPLRFRRAEAKRMVDLINKKLLHGWNPFMEDPRNKQFSHLKDALDVAINHKMRTISEKSQSNYRSRVKNLKEWLDAHGNDDLRCTDFTGPDAMDFMDYMLARGITNRTFNNYLIDMRSIFNHLVKRGYFGKNPFAVVDKLKEEEVRKIPFSLEHQKTYVDYCKQNDYAFYIISSLIYYCLARPTELCRLKIADIDTKGGFVHLHVRKGNKYRTSIRMMPKQMHLELANYIDGLPDTHYLISDDFAPGPNQRKPNRLSERFAQIRAQLQLPHALQLYSLKHTANDRLNDAGMDIKRISMHNDHTDIAMTSRYLLRRSGKRDERLYDQYPDFD